MEVARRAYAHTKSILGDKLRPGTAEFSMLLAPVIAYWVVAGAYELLDLVNVPALKRYRIERKERGRENRVTRQHVILRVILQHIIQLALGTTMVVLDPHQCTVKATPSWPLCMVQFGAAMLVMDTWQYFIHRWAHVNTYLYKHIHSTHHRLLIPYAIGALYNHPLEALVLDSLGAVVALYTTGMGCQVATAFFTFATVKTVLDHCGWRYPVNPIHDLFPNSAAYHDVHHDIKGIKKNFSQPFFTLWDKVLGTYADPAAYHISVAEATAAARAEGKKCS